MTDHRTVELEGISKAYDGVQALRDVSLGLTRGEIVGLIGANGAGKSTLSRVLAGAVAPDAGEVRINGVPLRLGAPRASLEAGIALVPQELQLVDTLSVAENVLLGHLPRRAGILNPRAAHRAAAGLLNRLGGTAAIEPDADIGSLSPVQQRLVTIARALSWRPQVLILDEPTAALPSDTASALLPGVRALAAEGVSVLYVSHRLAEVEMLSHRVIAMRNGAVVADRPASEISIDEMVSLVGGSERLPAAPSAAAIQQGVPVLTARGLTGPRVRDVDLDLRAGEILGVSGLQGSGRSELLRLLVGAQQPVAGTVDVLGRGRCHSVRHAASRGVGYIAEGRGLMTLRGMSVTSNLTVAALPKLTRLGPFISRKAEQVATTEMFGQLQIVGQPDEEIGTLSGGNQQKVFLGRWLLRHPQLMVFDEPTAGVDVGARAEFHALLRRLSEDGMAILLSSAEPEEVALVCTRAIVLVEGRVAEEFHRPLKADDLISASYSGRQ
jgi:ribose transport system ATP-binding protein